MNLAQANQLEELFCELSAVVNKKDAPTKFISDFESSLSRVLYRDYLRIAREAVSKGLQKFHGARTKNEAELIISTIEKEMEKFLGEVEGTIEKQIETFYKEVTRRFIDEFGLRVEKASKKEGGIRVSFNQKDREAIKATQRIGVASAGKYFPEQIKPKVSQVVRDVVFDEGLNTKEAAIRLQAEVEAAMGVDFAEAIPTAFASNPEAYFEILAINSSVQATSLGRLISMDDAGVKTYEVRAIIDGRTSDICRKLNGKRFSVQKTVGTVNKVFGATGPDILQNLMPFSTRGEGDATVEPPGWSLTGDGFPPYHHRCRTTVVPIVDI